MKCQFCEAESTNHIELEPGHILELCGKHYDFLYFYFTTPSAFVLPQECPSYTEVIFIGGAPKRGNGG